MTARRMNTRDIRDTDWNVTIDGNSWSHDQIHMALLVDIRRELKKLNAVFACPNFLEVPRTLRDIKRNTAKRKRPKVIGKPKLRVVARV